MVEHLVTVWWVVRSILHHGPTELFLFPTSVLQLCHPVCGMVHIKEPLLLHGKSSPCCGSRFPLSLSELSYTICPMLYNHKQNVLSASLNKGFPSFTRYTYGGLSVREASFQNLWLWNKTVENITTANQHFRKIIDNYKTFVILHR